MIKRFAGHSAIQAATCALEQMGRQLALDFGFAAFLDKFESYFGSLLTRILVGVMGAAVIAACLTLLGQFLISATALVEPSSRDKLNGLLLAGQIVVVVLGAWTFGRFYWELRKAKRERALLKSADAIIAESQAQLEEVRRFSDEQHAELSKLENKIGETIAAATMVLDDALQTATSRDLITQEQADLIRSLRGAESEKPL